MTDINIENPFLNSDSLFNLFEHMKRTNTKKIVSCVPCYYHEVGGGQTSEIFSVQADVFYLVKCLTLHNSNPATQLSAELSNENAEAFTPFAETAFSLLVTRYKNILEVTDFILSSANDFFNTEYYYLSGYKITLK